MRSRRLLRISFLLLAVVPAVACEDDPEPVTIERAAFVDTYVALRVAALQRGTAAVDGPVRDTVLAEAGVTEAELVTFAEVHGDDFAYMNAIWTEVNERLRDITFRPVGADSADAR